MNERGACAHCGLPLPRRPARVVLDGRTEACCCYGCVLALGVTRARGESGTAAALLIRLGLAVFFTMNVMMVTMPTYASVIYDGTTIPADGPLFAVLRALGVLLATPVLLLLGGPVLASAMGSLRSGLGVDALVVLGTAAAYALSLASVLRGGAEIYVDTACMLLVLVTLGRYLEAQAKAEAGAAVRATLGPAAIVARRVGAGHERVSGAELTVGDRILVGPGERFPTDGVVEQGTGGVDESMLTGESEAQLKVPGAEISGGTCSVDGRFVVRVTRPLAESAAARIGELLRTALATRTAAERLADRAAAALGPIALVVAAAAGTWWTLHEGLGRGVMVSLAVLVVACPCALGIATPAAIWMAVAAAAERGIVLRSAPVLERLTRVRRVLFDKTGTLTTASPRLACIEGVAGAPVDPAESLRLAAGLEAEIPHPVARALVAGAHERGIEPAAPETASLLPGRGVTGRVEGRTVTVGTASLLGDEGHAVDDPERRWTWVAVDDRITARVQIADALDPAAPGVLRALGALGLRVGLVSGAARADGVVPELMAAGDAYCGLKPEEKVALVQRLGADTPLAMVGDGLNDAPALAAAHVGIAVGRATDLTRLAADVVLLGAGLASVPWLVGLGRRTVRIARENLAWAFAYNGIALVLAATGRLTPVVAALAMLASSATVLANARRLRPRRRARAGAEPRHEPLLTPVSIAAARS